MQSDTPLMATEESLGSLGVREYLIVGGGLFGIALIGWAYMLHMAWAMANMDQMDMWMPPMASVAWAARDYFLLFVMWAVMMVAMMTPSTLPMVTMFATLNKNRRNKQQSYTPTFVFLFGYLLAWTGFSVVATLVQWLFHSTDLLNHMMNSKSGLVSGIILVIAGIYQWTPAKDACLKFCRTPLDFIITEWREGSVGAMVMGVKHGIFCVGCCWALMLILFAVGVMNMLWVALITAFVLIEKIVPFPGLMRFVSGLGLTIWGAVMLGNYYGI